VTDGAPSSSAVVGVVATPEVATRWADAVRARGLDARALPFAQLVPPPGVERLPMILRLGGHDLVIATSANALRFLPAGAGEGCPGAAVGAATAKAMEAAGFDVRFEGDAGSEALAKRLASIGEARRVLWLRGERANEAGVEILREADWKVDEVLAYGVAPDPAFAPAAKALGAAAAWVLGSPAAVEALIAAVGPLDAVPCVAAGPVTARALGAARVPSIFVAPHATREDVAATVVEALAPPG
jgi:uroporphyrinogen-III synthase